ncbi:MAG: hypothetical protein LBK56_07305 [Gracilibacteraceae bacterium]|jgi:pyruvate,water dikinase|nr:hypothetical protein [Gracilibacteraceae bacterium]
MIHTQENYDPRRIGGKAEALARLARITEDIPAWFVLDHEGASADETAQALAAFSAGTLFAVRSSAADEDGDRHSFAGQFATYLNVPRGEVRARVEDVRASARTERAEIYRREHGLPPQAQMAVLVQRMVQADCAGVAFGANPVTGDAGECVVSAVAGLGDALVDGSSDADTYHVRASEVIGEGGVLTQAQCLEVASLCRRAGRFFGRAQDIEWAYEEGRLFLLQSRPITSLRLYTGREGIVNIWDNSNIAESYNGVTTPLTFSFIRMAYEHVYREMCRVLGVSERVIAAGDFIFSHMLGLHDGQVYYNLLSWYKLVAILPGYKTNAAFMEQMMGVKENLPPRVRALLPQPSNASIWSAARKLFRHYRRLDASTADFLRLLTATVRRDDLSLLSTAALAAYYRDLESRLLKNWTAPVVNDFFAMIFYGLLKNTLTAFCGAEGDSLANALLRHSGDIISAEPARRVREMARLACRDDALVDLLLTGGVVRIGRELPEDLRGLFASYLDTFGDRCINELKLESATLSDDPLTLYRAVGNFARKLQAGQTAAAETVDEAAILRRAGWKRPLLVWLLRNARRTVRNRENLRFERTRVFGAVRSVFREIGARLASFGALDQRDDVFYLEYGEVLAYIEGTATTRDLRGLAALRRQEYAAYDGGAPDRFETYDCAALSARHPPETAGGDSAVPEDDGLLRGLGCCPGIVRGRARVVTDPAHAVIQPGEILVAQRTDPGWIMLFPIAAGVLVEYGSLLSHAAIVLREMGIPAVVSVPRLLARVPDGALVELDGEKGLVTLLEE